MNPNTVYLYRTDITTNLASFDRYRSLASEALSRLDFNPPDSGTILLKANATVLFPADKRVITHPGFLAGIADALIPRDVSPDRIVISDGQSGEQPEKNHTWINSGYQSVVDELGVRLAPMNGTSTKPVDVPNYVVFQHLPIYTEATDCSFFFNVPLAKCHNLNCTTLSVKNLMGILGRPERHLCAIQDIDEPYGDDLWRLTDSGLSLFEDRFYQKLCDTLAAFRSLSIPRLAIVDGLIGRDGTAFNEGDNYPLGWTLIGENEVHVDAIGTYLMGLDPKQTPYLRFANDRGLGEINPAKIEVTDLATNCSLAGIELASIKSDRILMPISGRKGGYYDRYRTDGSVVPWRIDDVNAQREKDGLSLIPFV
ncbi:MAG: DUF362 domain-containing protein [Candidatus Latescibacterota bacterium]|nr:DUF362 domain-containing protein [Candidatus Latescibacterota bacterium]